MSHRHIITSPQIVEMFKIGFNSLGLLKFEGTWCKLVPSPNSWGFSENTEKGRPQVWGYLAGEAVKAQIGNHFRFHQLYAYGYNWKRLLDFQ